MARIELNIVALGDFKSVNSQIAALKAQVDALNKSITGVGVNSNLNKQLLEANNAFKATMLSTGQFTTSTVKLKSETDKFGQSLVNGKLKLTEYFSIIKAGTANATAEMRALALEQTKLQNSIVMADPTKQGVMSVFTPTRINEAANATKIATNMQNLYNIAVNKGTQSLINWGKNTQWAGRQLTVGMTVPLTIFGSTAMNVFQQVNDELVRLQKVYGTGLTQPTQAALDQIKSQVLGLSKELASGMGVAVKDTAAMAADLAATGLQGVDLINSTREAIRLQKLGEMDTQSAMQTTISLQNVYKLNTNQLAGAVNFLNAVENQTSTSLQDLAAGIPKVGPIVQQLGGSFKDTAVMMVAMKEAGVPAAQSANAIKSAIASLINPTKAAKEAFSAYNINLSAISSKTNGNPILMIQTLQKAMEGLAPLAKAQLIEKLFGKFQEARIQALITNLGAVNSQTKTAFDLMNASDTQLAGIASGELKTATESVTGKFKRAVETMKADLLPVGEKIMSIATTLLNFGNSVAKVFSGLPGPVKTVMGIIAAGVALSGPIIMFTGVLANFVGYLMKGLFALMSLKNGTKTFGDLFTPEIIASQNAAEMFSTKIMEDESAVSLLNKAVQELTMSLEGMAAAMNSTSATTFAERVIAAEAGLAGGKIPFSHLSKGGIVPGEGNTDSVPSMLTPGEVVIPKGTVNANKSEIDALLKTGTFKSRIDLRSPVSSPRGTINDWRKPRPELTDEQIEARNERALAQIELNKQRRMAMLQPENNAGLATQSDKYNPLLQRAHLVPNEAGVMGFGTTSFNQLIRSNAAGASGTQSAQEVKTMINENFYKPYVSKLAKKIGADQAEVQAAMRRALENSLTEFEQNPTKIYGGRAGAQKFEEVTGKYIQKEFEQIHTNIAKSVDGVIQKQNLWQVTQGVRTDRSAGRSGGAIYDTSMFDVRSGRDLSKLGIGSATTTASGSTKARLALAKEYEVNQEKWLAVELNKISQSKSPSRVTKQAAKNMVDGVVTGIRQGAPIIAQETRSALIGPTMMNGSFYNNSPEAQPGWFARARGRLTNANGNLSLGAKMGGSMALMMGGQALAGMLPQGSNASSIAGSAMSMGGMGMMFGPWGAAAGAAIGLVTGGIHALMKAEKEHSIVAQQTFSSSTELAQIFGTNVTNATKPIAILTSAVSNASGPMSGFATDVKNTVDAIGKLPADNPLKLLLRDMTQTTAENAKNLAKSFITAQMALNGIDPQKAQDIYNVLMGASHHATAIGSKSNLPKSTQEAVAAYATGVDTTKITAVVGGRAGAVAMRGGTATSYGQLSKGGKESADKIQNVVDGLIGMDTKSKQYTDTLAGLNSKSINQKDAMTALSLSYGKTDKDVAKQIDLMNKNGLSVSQAAQLFKASSINATGTAKEIMDNLKKGLKPDAKMWEKIAKEIADGVKKGSGATTTPDVTGKDSSLSTAIFSGTTEEKDLKKKLEAKVKGENSVLKTLRDQLSVEQKKTAEIKRQRDYDQQRQDLNNQAKTALISGNYLQASMFRQQAAGAAVDFAAGTKERLAQDQIDKIQARTDVFSQALADLNDAIANGIKTINGTIKTPAGLAALAAGKTEGSVINVTINANGSVSGKEIASHVVPALKSVNPKAKVSHNNTKVTNQGVHK